MVAFCKPESDKRIATAWSIISIVLNWTDAILWKYKYFLNFGILRSLLSINLKQNGILTINNIHNSGCFRHRSTGISFYNVVWKNWFQRPMDVWKYSRSSDWGVQSVLFVGMSEFGYMRIFFLPRGKQSMPVTKRDLVQHQSNGIISRMDLSSAVFR